MTAPPPAGRPEPDGIEPGERLTEERGDGHHGRVSSFVFTIPEDGRRPFAQSVVGAALIALPFALLAARGSGVVGGDPQVRTATEEVALPLRTRGGHVVDAAGRRVRLSAVNWYGAESEDFAVGGLHLQPLDSIAERIRRLGFNAVRLPWSNELIERDPVVPDRALEANPELRGLRGLELLDRTVTALTERGLLVVLDNHNSDAEWCCGEDGNELWYNERYPEERWIADWQAIVRRYRQNPRVVGADLRNEPRGGATWGGAPEKDWHAAAERGGNAVLSVNPDLLVFVEGVRWAADLSGVAALPVTLDVPDRVVYEAHDYAWFEDHPDRETWLAAIMPRWGYLVTGPDPRPLWIGEFGTCWERPECVASDDPQAYGSWYGHLTEFIDRHGVDWAYWAVNGTQSTGEKRTFGAVEGYGVLDPTWTGPSAERHMDALRRIMGGG